MTDLQGVFQLFLYSACQPRMTRVLIFPIFMDTPEYGEIVDGSAVWGRGSAIQRGATLIRQIGKARLG